MLQKMVGAFYTILSLNYSCEDIIQGIKLNYQESCKKRGGEFHTEFTNYCYKDIRGTKLQGRVSKRNH